MTTMEADAQSPLEVLFDQIDVDESGLLDAEECRQLAQRLFCPDSSRSVSDDEASPAPSRSLRERVPSATLLRVRAYNSRTLGAGTMLAARSSSAAAQVAAMMGEMDADGDGTVNLDEFRTWWKQLGLDLDPEVRALARPAAKLAGWPARGSLPASPHSPAPRAPVTAARRRRGGRQRRA